MSNPAGEPQLQQTHTHRGTIAQAAYVFLREAELDPNHGTGNAPLYSRIQIIGEEGGLFYGLIHEGPYAMQTGNDIVYIDIKEVAGHKAKFNITLVAKGEKTPNEDDFLVGGNGDIKAFAIDVVLLSERAWDPSVPRPILPALGSTPDQI